MSVDFNVTFAFSSFAFYTHFRTTFALSDFRMLYMFTFVLSHFITSPALGLCFTENVLVTTGSLAQL